jgi:hypothetical protein
MTDEQFDHLMRDAARTYNRPPDEPPLEEMWRSIDRTMRSAHLRTDAVATARPDARRRFSRLEFGRTWHRVAAALVVGVAIGRLSVSILTPPAALQGPQFADMGEPAADVPTPYRPVTNHYLGEAAALLIALPGELRQGADASFVTRADDLLLQTRLLLDSPATSDPSLRMLFEDLEVVLVQVVRLQADRDPTRIDLLNQSLEQRDVIVRLRNAVADHIAD